MASPSRSSSVAKISCLHVVSSFRRFVTICLFPFKRMYSGSKSFSTLTPRLAHDSPVQKQRVQSSHVRHTETSRPPGSVRHF